MTEQKKHLIFLFIKKATLYQDIVTSIEQVMQLMWSKYPQVPKVELEKIQKDYSIEEYIRRLAPIIDEMFTEEELEICMKFYTTDPGKKLFDGQFLTKVKKTGESIFKDIENEFSMKNKRISLDRE